MNCDGVVDSRDIDGFFLVIQSQSAYALRYPACHATSADMNGDGLIDSSDLTAFVNLLTSH